MIPNNSPDTRLARTDDLLSCAQENGWLVEQADNRILLTAPAPLLGCFMEPQHIEAFDDGTGHLSRDKVHSITTMISERAGLSEYKIAGGGVLKAVKNTHHPLRSRVFFEAAGVNDSLLCIPNGVHPGALRNMKVKGYMTSAEADKWSIRLLKLHPAEVWGDAWVEAALRKFK